MKPYRTEWKIVDPEARIGGNICCKKDVNARKPEILKYTLLLDFPNRNKTEEIKMYNLINYGKLPCC